jgi:hypothetical protein
MPPAAEGTMGIDGVTPSRRARRWTRVEPVDARAGRALAADTSAEHHLVVFPARVVRCSCGTTIVATDPAVFRAPAGTSDDDSIAMHAAWCAELDLGDVSSRPGARDRFTTIRNAEAAGDRPTEGR